VVGQFLAAASIREAYFRGDEAWMAGPTALDEEAELVSVPAEVERKVLEPLALRR